MQLPIPAWFRTNAYGQFTYRVLLAIGSALVTVGLSYLPYDTILQAIWVVISTLFIATFALRQRLNETDEVRYRRLSSGRFEYLQKHNPEALNTVFAQNIRPAVFDWFESEYYVPIKSAKKVDALDSFARSGDLPGQLIFRIGVELGQWLNKNEGDPQKRLAMFEEGIESFINSNESLLGDEVAEGIYLRHVRKGEMRPVGIHMFHPKSRCLFTIEDFDYTPIVKRVALSLKSETVSGLSDEEWNGLKKFVHDTFPYFRPANEGSGPQKQRIPFFVSSAFDDWANEKHQVSGKLRAVMSQVDAYSAPAEMDASETNGPGHGRQRKLTCRTFCGFSVVEQPCREARCRQS